MRGKGGGHKAANAASTNFQLSSTLSSLVTEILQEIFHVPTVSHSDFSTFCRFIGSRLVTSFVTLNLPQVFDFLSSFESSSSLSSETTFLIGADLLIGGKSPRIAACSLSSSESDISRDSRCSVEYRAELSFEPGPSDKASQKLAGTVTDRYFSN